MDGEILKAVQNVGVDVSKDELIKALKYDRGQYQKGYEDGKEDITTQWIPVSERLPDDGEPILLTTKTYDGKLFVYSSIANKTIIAENSDLHIAWMPLPEPYKVGDNE